MKKILLVLALVLVPSLSSAQTATLQWDYVGKTLADIKSYVQEVKIDNVVLPTVPTCVTAGANVTCSVAAPSLATGTHVVSIAATLNGITATTIINGIGGAGAPSNPSSPKLNIVITINIGT